MMREGGTQGWGAHGVGRRGGGEEDRRQAEEKGAGSARGQERAEGTEKVSDDCGKGKKGRRKMWGRRGERRQLTQQDLCPLECSFVDLSVGMVAKAG